MGSGKTTVGRLLARELDYRFVDTDDLIEARAGKAIRTIFADDGEEAFRRLEHEAFEDLKQEQRVIVAAGGGAPVTPENRSFFREDAATFYLEVPFEEALRRTGADPARPLLARGAEALRALYDRRRPVYEGLGRRIGTAGREPAAVVRDILALLEERE
jgi:shikimate kinase